MPWLETDAMDQRTRLITDHRQDLYTMAELCDRYGISRKTGYKWLARYAEEGRQGLGDRSRAPHHCPHQIPEALATLLCTTRRHHPDWGAGKLLDYLAPRHPDTAWPAISTVNDLLGRHQLLTRRRRRRPHRHPGVVPPTTAAPNDLWTADFKGQFPTGDGVLCYPLTIADQHTRFLLMCHGLPSTHMVGARAGFERAFRTYACRPRSGPTTGCRSPAGACMASPSSTSGGCAWGFSISAFSLGVPSKTGRMNACIAP